MSDSLALVRTEVARVLAAIDPGRIPAVAGLVAGSPGATTLTGQGRSGAIAAMTAMRLMHLGFRAHAAGEPTAPSVGAGDLLVAVSGSGRTPVTIHHARIAREAGARVVVVTREAGSELAALADETLEIPAAGSEQPGGSLFEQTALLALDAVVHRLSLDVPDARALLRARHTNLQ